MAVRAAARAIERAGVDKRSIDLVVVGTFTSDMLSRETFGVIPPLGWAIGLSGVSLLITYTLLRRLIR